MLWIDKNHVERGWTMPTVMQRIGTPNQRHNIDNKYRRNLENVDPSLSQHNEVIRHRSIEDIYETCLQPAFVAFNERQKRKDRRLDVKYNCSTYLEYQRALDRAARASKNLIDKKGRPPIREIVWQFGNPEQGYGCAGQTQESRLRIKKLLMEVQREAEHRYPQLIWGDVVFHADEISSDAEDNVHGSIHLHSSFVPICTQNKQGPAKQVAFERCLKEMGFQSFEDWKHDLDDIMEGVLERHGMERIVAGNSETHKPSTEFHRQQAIIAQTKSLERTHDNLKDRIDEERTAITELTVETNSLNMQKATATKELYKTISDLDLANQELSDVQQQLKTVKIQIEQAESFLSRLKKAVAELKGTAEGKLLRVQEWLDKTLQRISRPSADEFKRVFQEVRNEDAKDTRARKTGTKEL